MRIRTPPAPTAADPQSMLELLVEDEAEDEATCCAGTGVELRLAGASIVGIASAAGAAKANATTTAATTARRWLTDLGMTISLVGDGMSAICRRT
jgi:hypothetical protein